MSTLQVALPRAEAISSFRCFGTSCSVIVAVSGASATAERDADTAQQRLLEWHRLLSRFEPDSELSRLNAHPATTVSVSSLTARFAEAVIDAGRLTGGLVDATLVEQIERAGYRESRERDEPAIQPPLPLEQALALAPTRRPAQPSPDPGWRKLHVDRLRGAITRPRGVRLDSGGVAKGLFVDLLARSFARHASFAVDCGGDIRLGGAAEITRPVHVESPFDGAVLHTFHLSEGAAATSGIGKRAWLDQNGRPAHHLLDPCTGTPAYTGIVQVSALAPTGVIAESLSKAALLAGPEAAPSWLQRGGVIVYDDGSHIVLKPA